MGKSIVLKLRISLIGETRILQGESKLKIQLHAFSSEHWFHWRSDSATNCSNHSQILSIGEPFHVSSSKMNAYLIR